MIAAVAAGASARHQAGSRAPSWRGASLLLAACLLLAPARGDAFEAFDGRLQLHGFVESQIRGISANWSQDADLTQWAWIANLEFELDMLDDTIGIFDLMQAYLRVEVRYDCVYVRGCGLFRSANTYGDRARVLPRRIKGGEKIEASGVLLVGEQSLLGDTGRNPLELRQLNPLDQLYDLNPHAFEYVYGEWDDFRFSQLQGRGGRDGGTTVRRLGPWLPKNFVDPIGQLSSRINPLDSSQTIPFKTAPFEQLVDGEVVVNPGVPIDKPGLGALPYRPIPDEAPSATLPKDVASGLHYPSPFLRDEIASGRLDSWDFNFTEGERSWNRGASQQQTKEVKEAYLDVEMFDARLWLRLGKQTIVWGKTELFRTVDQFNPQDFALSSIPSLEESRVALWAARGVWSFYEVGPLEDVRLEVAFNYDEFIPSDLGACGEPYAFELLCELTLGGYFHGLLGAGIAGQDRPPDPWDSIKGWEGGARLEFRWDRFSFAVSDFYGFSDFPHIDPIGFFERNVDPQSGRPRFATSRAGCLSETDAQRLNAIPEYVAIYGVAFPSSAGCLTAGPIERDDDPANATLLADPRNALVNHPAAEAAFVTACAGTVGFRPEFDPAACALNVFNSHERALGVLELTYGTAALLAGGETVTRLFVLPPPPYGIGVGVPMPTVQLVVDPFDGVNAGEIGGWDGQPCFDPTTGAPCMGPGLNPLAGIGETLGQHITPEQAALLGCGPFWGTNCDDSGIDLLNADASVLIQSWPGIEGTGDGWRTNDATVAQPGTVGMRGVAPICTQGIVGGPLDPAIRSPGCRGPGEPGYNVRQDGSTAGLAIGSGLIGDIGKVYDGKIFASGHPFTGQTFSNEMAALSWNLLLLTVAQGRDFQDGYDPDDPQKLAREAFTAGDCGLITPQKCETVRQLFDAAGVGRPTLVAGGNERFGRRNFIWHSGGEVVLRYPKRNVLGFSMDFAEDRSKSNFSLEFAWINDVLVTDRSSLDYTSTVDDLSLSISVDRPTFINFLNRNRTFFMNMQWFIQYRAGDHKGVAGTGPWNALGTFTVTTGYFQDRLLPSVTFVYDVQSVSGAALPQLTYRFSQSFSVSVGANFFIGRTALVDMAVRDIAPVANRRGPDAYRDGELQGLSALKTRDEVFLRLRYTF